MDKNPKIRRAIKLMGGVVATQKALNLETYQTVQQWIRSGAVPPQYCCEIERLTNEKVKRNHLRPNDWHLIWPDFGHQKQAA